MNELQQHIGSKVQEASNKVHQKILKGGADVVFVSKRVMNEIESVIDKHPFKHFSIVEASGWFGAMEPCDIRAVTHMGHCKFEFREPESSGLSDEQMEEIIQNPENSWDSREEFEEDYEVLEIPEIEFETSEEEWVETYDITLEDKLFDS